MEELAPFDICIVNGDATEGQGQINGGVELITSDMLNQVEMAQEALELARAKKYGFIVGSAYHTGKTVDFERVLSENMDGIFFESRHTVDIEGTIFDFKHEIGGTSIPHGKATAINKENLWGLLKHERGIGPKIDVMVRSHVHKFHAAMDTDGLRMTTPALQFQSNYGVRKFSSIIDMGFIVFEIHGPGEYTWKPYILDIKELNKEVQKL